MNIIPGSYCFNIRRTEHFTEMFIFLSSISKDGSTLEPTIDIISPKTGIIKTYFNTGEYWNSFERGNVLTYRDTLEKSPDFRNLLYVLLDR